MFGLKAHGARRALVFAHAHIEFSRELIQIDSVTLQNDEKMIHDIGGFIAQMVDLGVTLFLAGTSDILGGKRHFARFFHDLLQDVIVFSGKKTMRIAFLTRIPPSGNGSRKRLDGGANLAGGRYLAFGYERFGRHEFSFIA